MLRRHCDDVGRPYGAILKTVSGTQNTTTNCTPSVTGNNVVGTDPAAGQQAPVGQPVTLTICSVTVIHPTVTVPDGGTVLLGGVKRLREERREFGVPILSKVPMINRLFRNIGIGRETDSLMLMVTPRIIILEEEEEKLGIPAVPNANGP